MLFLGQTAGIFGRAAHRIPDEEEINLSMEMRDMIDNGERSHGGRSDGGRGQCPAPTWIRIISLTLVFTMVLGDPLWAAGVSDFLRVSFSRDIKNLTVPSKFGTITDKWIAKETRRGGSPCPPANVNSDKSISISRDQNCGQAQGPAPTGFEWVRQS